MVVAPPPTAPPSGQAPVTPDGSHANPLVISEGPSSSQKTSQGSRRGRSRTPTRKGRSPSAGTPTRRGRAPTPPRPPGSSGDGGPSQTSKGPQRFDLSPKRKPRKVRFELKDVPPTGSVKREPTPSADPAGDIDKRRIVVDHEEARGIQVEINRILNEYWAGSLHMTPKQETAMLKFRYAWSAKTEKAEEVHRQLKMAKSAKDLRRIAILNKKTTQLSDDFVQLFENDWPLSDTQGSLPLKKYRYKKKTPPRTAREAVAAGVVLHLGQQKRRGRSPHRNLPPHKKRRGHDVGHHGLEDRKRRTVGPVAARVNPALQQTFKKELAFGFHEAYDDPGGVYYNPKTKAMYVAGMRPNGPDIMAGVESAIAPDELVRSERYLNFVALYDTLRPKYVFGHSMGGVVIDEYFRRHNTGRRPVLASFNSPFSTFAPARVIPADHRYRHPRDFISGLDRSATVIDDEGWWQHGYDNFPVFVGKPRSKEGKGAH